MEDCSVPFWDQQKLMFNRCIEIEKTSNIGIMADRPGSGKTYVALAIISNSLLISRDKKKTNIIVVGENIYTQWIESINKFRNLKFKKFIEYGDITQLFFDSSIIKKYDILLTTPLYYNVVMQTMKSVNLSPYRLIVDEIDSVSNILTSSASFEYLWLISGTFNKAAIGNLKDFIQLENKNIDDIICKFENHVYQSVENLEEPIHHNIYCKNIYLDNILSCFENNLLTKEHLDKLNALDIEGFKSMVGITKELNSMKEITQEFLKMQDKTKRNLINDLKLTEANMKVNNEELNNLMLKKNSLTNEEKQKINFLQDNIKSLDDKFNNLDARLKDASLKYEKIQNRIKDENMCMICYSDEENKYIATDCCNSIYCEDCITKWLLESKNCPYCKTSLETENFNPDNYLENFKLFEIDNDNKKEDIISNILKKKSEYITSDYNIQEIKEEVLSQLKKYNGDFNKLDISKYNGYLKPDDCQQLLKEVNHEIILNFGNLKETEINRLKFLENNVVSEKNEINSKKKLINKTDKNIFEKKSILEDTNYKLDNMINKMKSTVKKNYGENIEFSKIDKINEILDSIDKNDKIIIFSSYIQVFTEIINILNDKDRDYIEIDTADIEQLTIKIDKFKNNPNCNILMAESSTHGAGLNLEFTDKIIILHQMSDELKCQLISRAQRPGRKSKLEVYQLLHLNEDKSK